VFISFIGPESKVKFLKQAREFGINAPIYSSSDIQNETLLNSFGKYMEGVVYTFPKTSGKYEEFVQKYEDIYGVKPQGPSSANTYDAVMISIIALSKSGDLKKNIESSTYKGVSVEDVSFNEEHQLAKSNWIIKTVKDGKFVEVN
jgi:ABC-type branched-subunit amino acid transport system substrate-binding protein